MLAAARPKTMTAVAPMRFMCRVSRRGWWNLQPSRRADVRDLAQPSRKGSVKLDRMPSLLEAYESQLRTHVHDRLPDSIEMERDGPLLRTVGYAKRGFVEYR